MLLKMSNEVEVNNTVVVIDPNSIFDHLCFLGKSTEKLRPHFFTNSWSHIS